jgi:hypothetical protein
MATRRDRIITGAKFIAGLGADNKWSSSTFGIAAARLIELLQAELSHEPEETENLIKVQEALNTEYKENHESEK